MEPAASLSIHHLSPPYFRRLHRRAERRLIFANCRDDGAQRSGPSLMEIFHRIDPGKEWFTAKEVAALLGRTDQFVRDLLENGRILGHALHARGTAARKSHQIHRQAVELYLLETANFFPNDYVRCLLDLAKRLPRAQRELLRSQL
ncbi:MAG: hypothetical protein LBP65_01045 [Puniceicoccales bacterium]|jgi:hypothetical protein|nr:hypothetical protein [Puniceicoccales bacterium]